MVAMLYHIGICLLIVTITNGQELECNTKSLKEDYEKSFNDFTTAYIIGPTGVNESCFSAYVSKNAKKENVDFFDTRNKESKDVLSIMKQLPDGQVQLYMETDPPVTLNVHFRTYDSGLLLAAICNSTGNGQDIHIAFPMDSPNKDELLKQADEVVKIYTKTPEIYKIDHSNCPQHKPLL